MDIQIEKFSYAGFVSEAINRTAIHSEKSRKTGKDREKFTGTKDFEEAEDFARNGWDLGLEQFKVEDTIMVGGTTHMQPALAGCVPHVQNHIMGFPEQMYSLYDEREYNLPTLDLIVPLQYSAFVNSEDVLTYCKSLSHYINTMASKYNIRLTGVFSSTHKGETEAYLFIDIKKFDEPLVINNIAFSFHPSFLRRMYFSVVEGRNWLDTWGYGSPISDAREVIEKELGTESVDNRIYLKSLSNISNFGFEVDEIDTVSFT